MSRKYTVVFLGNTEEYIRSAMIAAAKRLLDQEHTLFKGLIVSVDKSNKSVLKKMENGKFAQRKEIVLNCTMEPDREGKQLCITANTGNNSEIMAYVLCRTWDSGGEKKTINAPVLLLYDQPESLSGENGGVSQEHGINRRIMRLFPLERYILDEKRCLQDNGKWMDFFSNEEKGKFEPYYTRLRCSTEEYNKNESQKNDEAYNVDKLAQWILYVTGIVPIPLASVVPQAEIPNLRTLEYTIAARENRDEKSWKRSSRAGTIKKVAWWERIVARAEVRCYLFENPTLEDKICANVVNWQQMVWLRLRCGWRSIWRKQ